MTKKDQRAHEFDSEAIAIVGMSCRFPGINSLGQFWDDLMQQRESVSPLSAGRLERAGVDHSEVVDPGYVAVAALIDGVDEFDAAFFGYTPREAQIRDPQSRLFLEHRHGAIEDSGHDPRRMPGLVGVYGGMANNLDGERQVARNAEVSADRDRRDGRLLGAGRAAAALGGRHDSRVRINGGVGRSLSGWRHRAAARRGARRARALDDRS